MKRVTNAPGNFPTDVSCYAVDGYDVFSWCPTQDGSGRPQQVHVHLRLGESS
jgi:hypothetical protein